jgi:hypothetical protein
MVPVLNPRGRRALLRVALAGALATIVFVLAQCTMVGEQLTGVDTFRRRAPECVRACNLAFKDARRAEKRLHKENLKACREDHHHDCEDARDDEDDLRAAGLSSEIGAAASAEAGLRPGVSGDDRYLERHRKKDRECIKAEERRHRQAMKELRKARKECIRNCHHQGGGVAG